MKKIIYITFLLMFLISNVFSQKTNISFDNQIAITQNLASINPVTNVSITASQNPFCIGYPVTFNAVVVNAVTPTYQWKVNNIIVVGATMSSYTYTPTNNSTIMCIVNGTVNSNTITMVQSPNYWYSSMIKSTAVKVQPSTSVTFTAIPTNGGASPTYQWFVNNAIVQGATSMTYTYVPLNGDKVKCNVYSSLVGCVNGQPSSNTITITVTTVTNECPGLPSITYEGKVYRTVQIGTQCWLKDNLNVGTKIDVSKEQTKNGIVEKYCMYGYESNCDIYGGLYNFSEAVNYLNGVTNTTNWNPIPTGNVQGLCPNGWHIPTLTEWNILVNYLGPNAGGKMKEPSFNHWSSPNIGADNTSDWTGFGSGNRWSNGTYNNFGKYVSYWTVTGGYDGGVTSMYYGGMSYSISNPTSGQFYKNNTSSIRCLKD